jgi:hypothetical protein
VPVRQAEAFAETLRAKQMAVTVNIFPHAKHGIPLEAQDREIDPFLEAFLRSWAGAQRPRRNRAQRGMLSAPFERSRHSRSPLPPLPVAFPRLFSSRSSRRLSRVSHAQREQSLWSLPSIDDGARDPMTGRCGWTDGDGGLKCLDAQLKPPDRPMSGGL